MRTAETFMAYVAVVDKYADKRGYIGETWDDLLRAPQIPAPFAGTQYPRPTINQDHTEGETEEGDRVDFYLTHLLSMGIH